MVRDDDGDAELVGETLEGAHELRKVGLPGGELAAAGEVGAVEGCCRVDDEEGEAGFTHHVRGLVEELQLMIRVVGAGVGDVVEYLFSAQAVSVGYTQQSHGTERPFGVNVQTFPLPAAHVER